MRKDKAIPFARLPSSNFSLTLPTGRTCQGTNNKEGFWFAQYQPHHHKARCRRVGLELGDETLIKNMYIYSKKQQQHMHQHVNSGYYWMVRDDYEWFNFLRTFLHFPIFYKITHNNFLTLYKKADFWLKER